MIDYLKRRMGDVLTVRHCNNLVSYFAVLSYETVITFDKASRILEMDEGLLTEVLDALVEYGSLLRLRGIRCPYCNHKFELLKNGESSEENELYCFACHNDVRVYKSHIEEFYKLKLIE